MNILFDKYDEKKGEVIFSESTMRNSNRWNFKKHDIRFLVDALEKIEDILLKGKHNIRQEIILNIKCFRTFLRFYDKLPTTELIKIYKKADIGLSPINFEIYHFDDVWMFVDWKYYIDAINRLNKHWKKRIAAEKRSFHEINY